MVDENTTGVNLEVKDGYHQFTVPLVSGKNVFQGAAYDIDYTVYGVSSRLAITSAAEIEDKPDIYILSVGISLYRDPALELAYPAADSKDISKVLKKIATGRYNNVHISQLVNREATRQNIMKELKAISLKAKVDDTVIVFFAGHGYTKNEKYFFLPYDASRYNLAPTCIASKDFYKFFNSLVAKKVALFLDSCHSGAAIDSKVIADIGKESGIVIFSAVAESKVAYEREEISHGVFTYSILDAIENRAPDVSMNLAGKRYVIIGKLLSTVYYITIEVAATYELQQSPIKFTFGVEFDIGIID